MTSLATKQIEIRATAVRVSDDALIIDLTDGRTVSAPLAWYPRLVHGTAAERQEHQLIGQGLGIHWPQLDEDISVEGILAGTGSNKKKLWRPLQKIRLSRSAVREFKLFFV